MACSTSCSNIHLHLMERSRAKLSSWYVTGILTAASSIYKRSSLCQMEVPHTALNRKRVVILSLYRLKSARVTDKRVRVMNEIISGMRLIKMYAWEWAFHEYVKKIRKLVITYYSYPYLLP